MNERLVGVLAEVFDLKKSEVTLELKKEDLANWDSLKQMDLITRLESEFDLAFVPKEIVSMTSAKTIIKILSEKGIE